jgi:hypothetical protein
MMSIAANPHRYPDSTPRHTNISRQPFRKKTHAHEGVLSERNALKREVIFLRQVIENMSGHDTRDRRCERKREREDEDFGCLGLTTSA